MRSMSAMDAGEGSLRGADERDRADGVGGCVQAVPGGGECGASSVPGGETNQSGAPTVSDLLDAVSLHGDACARLESAIRDHVATGPALAVCVETYREVIRLADALTRAA